jgi:hypothetical protein
MPAALARLPLLSDGADQQSGYNGARFYHYANQLRPALTALGEQNARFPFS